jgi:atypical dual specificity phosphatase|eukprot:TRINITY_DN77730_c0_g1_i1.p1 TRINITY_DN77730_c0_g1~~TRINITY_DN77730_c0_g1_i1.p1  ORF type:complete len:281 (+),score=57.15 TRINITY_DN77730_c0_g1_i1:167-1009(+)
MAPKAAPPPVPKGIGKGQKGNSLTEEELEEKKAKQEAFKAKAAAEREKFEAMGSKMDEDAGLEIENVDLSKVDPTAVQPRVKCDRCELDILVADLDSHMNSHSSEILPWLFLGGQRNMENPKELTVRTGITHILNVAQEYNLSKDTREEWEQYNTDKGLPTVYQKVSMGDTLDQDLLGALEPAVSFVRDLHLADPKHHVLVNCVQGISRSSSTVIAYLMQYEKMSLREAYQHVKTRRSIAEPRRCFVDQLGVLEMKLFGIEAPTITGEEVYRGKNVLNVD